MTIVLGSLKLGESGAQKKGTSRATEVEEDCEVRSSKMTQARTEVHLLV